MAFKGPPDRSTGSITPSFGKRSPSNGVRVAATDNSRPDSDDDHRRAEQRDALNDRVSIV